MKKTSIILFSFALILAFSFNSCYNESEEELYPGSNTCDLTNVTYSNSIAPMFSANCNSCHNSTTASGNIITDNYTSVKANMSRIRGCINHLSGYSPMPKNANQLSTCDLSKVDVWINQGMPNN
jgi:hypothetical protein